MKPIKVMLLVAAALVAGVIATALWYSHVLRGQIASKSVEVAFRAAEEAEWLALLRLQEATNALASLERSLHIGVATLAQWDEVARMGAATRRARDRFLVPAKVYFESFPPRGAEAALINNLLRTVPGRSPDSVCKSGVCRLDDLRLNAARSSTNTPAR
jgi:hypothetical protein